jgi:hypothetical protein
MLMSEIVCRKCHGNAMDAAARGTYLLRKSPKGEVPCVMECAASCQAILGEPAQAVIDAIRG